MKALIEVDKMTNEAVTISVGLAFLLSSVLVPFILYWAASFIFPLKLQTSVLSRQLWQTIALVAIIIVINYIAVFLEGRDWGDWILNLIKLFTRYRSLYIAS